MFSFFLVNVGPCIDPRVDIDILSLCAKCTNNFDCVSLNTVVLVKYAKIILFGAY